MKVNFTKIKVRQSLYAEAVERDLTKEIANAIWQGAKNVAEANFANKLFESNGDLEITEEQAGFIRNAVEPSPYWAKQPILEQLEKTE